MFDPKKTDPLVIHVGAASYSARLPAQIPPKGSPGQLSDTVYFCGTRCESPSHTNGLIIEQSMISGGMPAATSRVFIPVRRPSAARELDVLTVLFSVWNRRYGVR